ncbi:cytochrome P450 [Streptosporangiaceae bacterium NEAU-GS5]|nr:cytochrome P450 [Streptosporangiaceae bacterium NEAU-GS5]
MTDIAFSPREILGFDPFDPGFIRDPYAHYRELPRPLFRTEAGMWVATAHETCAALLRDNRFGHSEPPPDTQRSFLMLDPPAHTRLRGLVSRAFTARMVERLRPRIERIVDDLVDALPATADLISGLAYPLPVLVICELLGVPPEDHDRLHGWSEALARGLDPDFLLPADVLARRDEARRQFNAYFAELADRRAAEPGDDLLSALTKVEELTREELLATCILLLVAGHETTVNLIGNGTLALLRADALARFTPQAVEELLRYDPPVQLTIRFAHENATLGGVDIRQGEAVVGLIGAANRDPAAFADPDTLDLGRGPTRHLAFGLGIHFCLGAPLARMEGALALSALARRRPGLRLLDPAPPYKQNLVLRGLAELRVE